MKTLYKVAALTLIVFSVFFALSTLGYSVVDPSIGTVRVVRYGFPMTWLRITTATILPSSPQYTILWLELLVDTVFCLALSTMVSFGVMKSASRLEAPVKTSLISRFFLVIIVAYITRLLSCGIHEFLGHGLWAWIFGAYSVQVHVSWLGFGWCRAWGMSGFYTASVMFSSGGLLNTFIIGAVILALLYLMPRKGGFYVRFSLFWLGFWATINQASYLLLGGLTGYGDVGSLHSLTGVPLNFFTLLGFSLFFLVYVVVSGLFLSEVRGLFPEYRERVLLFEFWFIMPVQVILFVVSHTIASFWFLPLVFVSLLPSLLSAPLFPLFEHLAPRREFSAQTSQ